VLHRWQTDPVILFPESPIAEDRYPHGCYLQPDGSVLFNIEYVGLAKLDSTGKVQWTLNEPTHHSIARDDDGSFWVCVGHPFHLEEKIIGDFPGLHEPFEDSALNVSPDGKIIRRVNILQAVYDSRFRRAFFRTGKQSVQDVIHLNDVEPLPRDIADSYPLFNPGDLVISCREIHLVAVLDSETGRIKWGDDAHFNSQHDPDFIGDGWIRVFDNNRETTATGEILGGSRIVDIQPHTGEIRVVYPTADSSRFYTDECGKTQTLSNGNILITEAKAGRVFEVDPTTGKTVWEWIHEPYSEDPSLVAEVLQGTRYGIAPEVVKSWSRGQR
jgi:hypothetical protein